MIALKKEVNPTVFWVALGILLVAVVAIGYRMLGNPTFKAQTAGGEDIQKKFKETGEFYKPPPGIVRSSAAGAPGAMGMPPGMSAPAGAMGGGGAPGAPMGGYNLNPPSH